MMAEISLDSFMAEAYIVAAARTAGGKRGGRLSGWLIIAFGLFNFTGDPVEALDRAGVRQRAGRQCAGGTR